MALLALGVGLFFAGQRIDACTCSAPPLSQALAQAETAFVGTVRSIGLDAEKEKHVVIFSVVRVFKGSAPATSEVVTPVSEGSCGFTFSSGATYLVFTRNIKSKRLTHLCAGNVPASAAGPWPRELLNGWSPR